MKYDFSGWATKNDLRCSDGRTIRHNAFKGNDGATVPLVWNHKHDDPENVLGHALLENRDEGVYAYGVFNDTPKAQHAKEMVMHEDIVALSIYANGLKQNGGDVLHGNIREVSLVLAGANPGAFIDSVIAHGEYSDEEAIIFTGESFDDIAHSDKEDEDDKSKESEKESMENEKKTPEPEKEEKDESNETIGDVYETFNDKQKKTVDAMLALALRSKETDDEEEKEDMKHNLFDNDEQEQGDVISHAQIAEAISEAKRYGSMKDSFLAHGIEDVEFLFPEARNLNNPPEFIKRDTGWVSVVMNGVHHTPLSRIKSMFADLREDEARAKGYIKGNLKKEEVFSLLKRSTDPTTIYKKQKMDRDDVVDITDFDVIAWLKGEMRMMLDEEIARAILIGDGRLSSSDDKIDETKIRPISNDADLYTVKVQVSATSTADAIDDIIRARKEYKGSGNPTFFTTEDFVTECLLLKDTIGHRLYKDEAELATALRVSKIVAVEVMEGAKGAKGGDLVGVIVNLADYNVGADKGGAVNMFDDFDIDYNAQKYLIETRCSGALIKPFSALAIEKKTQAAG